MSQSLIAEDVPLVNGLMIYCFSKMICERDDIPRYYLTVAYIPLQITDMLSATLVHYETA